MGLYVLRRFKVNRPLGLSGQAQAAADDWTADAQNTPQVWLHVQLLNASATVVADARDRALAVGGVSVCHASVTLPPLPTFGPQTQRMAEHRTWFAAARLQCLPWWLARAKKARRPAWGAAWPMDCITGWPVG